MARTTRETEERAAITIDEACRSLKIGRTKLYSEIAAGRFKSVKIGRRRVVPAVEPAAYLRRFGKPR